MSERPLLTSECRSMPRPCPYFSCRQNLVVTANGGSLVHIGGRKHGPKTLSPRASAAEVERWSEVALELLETAPETCALDVAERGGATLQEIGDIYGISKWGVELAARKAMAKLVGLEKP